MDFKELTVDDLQPIEFTFNDETSIKGYITDCHISYASLPQSVFKYGIRHDDNNDRIPVTMETHRVLVNKYGTFLTKQYAFDEEFKGISDWNYLPREENKIVEFLETE
ncbi:MAG: hypothetical protein J6N78_01990 [Clostridia bacterium]|nr:hypothetical protein [Clostridia bacterium]